MGKAGPRLLSVENNLKGNAVRHTFAGPIATAALIASLLVGCGGGGSSSSSTTAASSTSSSSATQVCADLSKMQSAADDLKQLDASTASTAAVKQAIFTLGVSAQALVLDASQATGQAQADLKAATNKFKSQLKSAVDQPVSQQLVTVGNALSQFQSSLSQTTAQFNCNR